MRENIDETDVETFDKFIEKHWKKSKTMETVTVNAQNEENKPKRRGRKPNAEKI